MDFLQKLLSEHGGELVQRLVGQLGFSPDQARRFVPEAAQRVIEVVRGGGLDLSSLLGGAGAAQVVEKVDTGALAREAGVDEAKATSGLQALAPTLLSLLKTKGGSAEGVLSMLGGGTQGGLLGGAGKLAGKLFK